MIARITITLLALLVLEKPAPATDDVAAAVPTNEITTVAAARFAPIALPPQERIRIAFLTVFGVTWFFWLGAALGSYLNVVVYRLPLGRASVAPDSRCPNCETPIRWYDNIPVFSWLRLRGRCRACQSPISPRYLLIELVLGGLFVLLLCVEVLTGGVNLPVREPGGYLGMPLIEHFMEWDLLGLFAYHAALAWLTVGIVMFTFDGNRVPDAFAISALLMILVPPLLWPELRPVPLWQPASITGFQRGLMEGIAGVAAGAILGYVLSLGTHGHNQRNWLPAIVLLGVLVGGSLGWHATLIWFALVSLAWMLHQLVLTSVGSTTGSTLVTVAAAALLALLTGWRGLQAWFPAPMSALNESDVNYLPIVILLPVLPLAIARYVEGHRLTTRVGPPRDYPAPQDPANLLDSNN